MKSNGFRNLQVTLAGLQSWVVLIAAIWLLSSIGLWWLIKSFFILLALLFILPIGAVIVLRFWLQRNIIQGECPVCGQGLVGVNNQQMTCPSCNEPLMVVEKTIKRVSPPGTVDVDVVDVSVTELTD